MLPSPLLIFTLTLLTPLILATSQAPASCSSSPTGQEITTFVPAYNTFRFLDTVVDPTFKYTYFNYHPSNEAGCKGIDCLRSFGNLLKSFQFNNHTTGSGNTALGCGAYGCAVGAPKVPSSTVAPAVSQTGKLDVGPTVLGTSCASLMKISGSLMFGIAVIFVFCL